MRMILAILGSLAIAAAAPAQCPPSDRDGSGAVSIDEAIGVVAAALHGCPVPCPGDCDSDGFVTDQEIVLVDDIVFGEAPLFACRAADPNGDCAVQNHEHLAASQIFLEGGECPAE